jgi:acyl carrier protein
MQGELDRITAVICSVGKLTHVEPDADFYEAGLSSINALELLLELETTFDASIPDDEFITARTPRALATIIGRLKEQVQPA